MNTKNFKNFNKLKCESSELKEPLNQRLVTQNRLIAAVVNHVNNSNWRMLKNCLVAIEHNAIKLSDLMDKQEKVFDAILKLLEEVIMDQMCLDALSVYSDYITDLVEEIEVKLGTKTWNKIRNAIRRKRKKNKKDFEKKELGLIKKLEKTLKGIMTVKEFELLMKMKVISNTKFYKGESLKLKNAKEQLETSLPDNLQVFKEPLRKLLYVHEIWGLSS